MKSFIYSLLLSAMVFHMSLSSCEIYDYSINRIKYLDCGINKIEEDVFYTENMDYYVGYLKGQRQAFYEVKTLIDDLYPN